MTKSFSTLRVNADRMHDSFIHLASIGATEENLGMGVKLVSSINR